MQSSTVEAAEKAKDELQQIQKQLQDLLMLLVMVLFLAKVLVH